MQKGGKSWHTLPLYLNDNVCSHNNDIAKDQEDTPPFGKVEVVEGNEEHGDDKEEEKANGAH